MSHRLIYNNVQSKALRNEQRKTYIQINKEINR